MVFDTDAISQSPLNMSPPTIDTNLPSRATAAAPVDIFGLASLPIDELRPPANATMLAVRVLRSIFHSNSRLFSNPAEMLSEADKFLQEIMPERYAPSWSCCERCTNRHVQPGWSVRVSLEGLVPVISIDIYLIDQN